jgi:hypothetical protein
MLFRSQPITTDERAEWATDRLGEARTWKERPIKSQRVGGWLDDVNGRKRTPLAKLALWVRWRWSDVADVYRVFKNTFANHVKWHKTFKELYSWNGDHGFFLATRTHLGHYLKYEEKHGHSIEEHRNKKMATVKEAIELLERMTDPDEYRIRRADEVESRYPKYGSLITEYAGGGSCHSGNFVAQGNGWAGVEGGEDPREGYFEFVDCRLELATSPDPAETKRLLEEMGRYHQEMKHANEQADVDSDNDFDRLHQLLKENLYSWWD